MSETYQVFELVLLAIVLGTATTILVMIIRATRRGKDDSGD